MVLIPKKVVLVAALVLAACGGSDGGATSGGRVQVVASFYPLAEAARRVGGPTVEVVDLTPVGSEPHDLELTPDDVDTIQDADVVFHVGRGFQPAVEDAAEARDGTTVDLLRRGESDPHFWLDPSRMKSAAERIEDVLADAAPEQADNIATRGERYQRELTELDADMADGLRDCRRSDIVTAHDAFGHLARRYRLVQHAIAGLSPESEPNPRRLADLVELVRAKGVTIVFYETLVDPDVAETLAREADVETAVLNPIEGLTRRQIEQGKDYAAVMRDNLAALRRALDCR